MDSWHLSRGKPFSAVGTLYHTVIALVHLAFIMPGMIHLAIPVPCLVYARIMPRVGIKFALCGRIPERIRERRKENENKQK